MSLIVGIVNGKDKGFTENDLDLINGFPFGMIMMVTGTGKIDDVDEFIHRTLEANFMNEIYDKDKLRSKLTVEFVEKMKGADWSCNVGYSSKREYNSEIKRRLYETHKYDFVAWMENRGKYAGSEEE